MTYPVFPSLAGRGWPRKRTPLWSSTRQTSANGQDSRFQMWSYPRYRYDIPFSVLRTSSAFPDLDTLLGFYNSVAVAPGQLFRFTDPADSLVTAQGFGVGDGTKTVFQLVRAKGGFVDPVLYPTTASIAVAGTHVTAVTVAAGGVVTFATAPSAGAALTWTGTFDWLTSFDDDLLEFTQIYPQFWTLGSLKFTTEKF